MSDPLPTLQLDEDPFADLRWKEPPRQPQPTRPVGAALPYDLDSIPSAPPVGGGTLPPVRAKSRVEVRTEGGLIDFVGNHKLVLTVFAFCAAFMWVGIQYSKEIAGFLFAMLGIVLGAGAWRSQKLAERHDKEAEDWRYFERYAGIVILLAVAAWATWFVGIRIWDAIEKGQEFGFGKVVYEFILTKLGFWAVFVGYLTFVHVLSQRFGFFKPAGWSYFLTFFLTWAVMEAEKRREVRDGWPNRPVARQERNQQPQRPMNRPGFGGAPVVRREPEPQRPFSRFDIPSPVKNQANAAPADDANQSMAKLSGIPAPDVLSAAPDAVAANIPEIELGAGTDAFVSGRSPAVRWSAQPDPPPAEAKGKSSEPKAETAAPKQFPQIALAADSEVILPRGISPWIAVSSGGKELATSLKLYNLKTLAEREIKGRIAVGTPSALSPDGKYFAGYNSQEQAIDVWSFEKGKSIARLRIAPLEAPLFVEFGAKDEIVVGGDIGFRYSGTAICQVWNLSGDGMPRQVALPKAVKFTDALVTISPGGKYLAACDKGGVWLIEIESGRLRGKLKIDEQDRSEKFHMSAAGLSFSPEGEELACLVDRFHGCRLLAWNMKDGALLADHVSETEYQESAYSDKRKGIHIMPDRKNWLVSGRAIVDAKSGEPAWLGLTYKDGIFDRKLKVYGLADSERLIVGSDKMISTWTVPRGLDGELERKSLVVSADDLPSAMFPEAETRPFWLDDEDEQTLFAEEFELASRKYRQAAQLKMLAANDEKLSSLFGWYPAAKRPTFGLRVGVGAQAPDGSKDVIPLASMKSLSEFTGPVGPTVVNELRKRFAEDAFGDWPQTEDAATRGITYVGIGPRDKVIASAKTAELDIVIMLEVTRQPIGNTKRFDMLLRARVSDASGEPVWVSPALSSEKAKAAEWNKQDLVKPFVAEVMAKIDELYTLKALPPAKPQAVKERAKVIAAKDTPDANRLLVAAELRYYQINGLLTPEEALPAYRKLFDDATAEAMASGDVRKRREALDKWASEHSL